MIYKLFKKIYEKRLKKDFFVEEPKKQPINPFEIGQKVIVIGNEPEDSLMIGIIEGFDRIGSSLIPLVNVNGNVLGCFGKVLDWTPEKEKAFNKLTWDERYNVACNYSGLSQADIDRKNSKEYKERNFQK